MGPAILKILLKLSSSSTMILLKVCYILDIREQLQVIEKSVQNKEPRFMLRVLRQLATTRRGLTPVVLHKLVRTYIPDCKFAILTKKLAQPSE